MVSRNAGPFGRPDSIPAMVPATRIRPSTLPFVFNQFCGLNLATDLRLRHSRLQNVF
jgi:hypothetical protein